MKKKRSTVFLMIGYLLFSLLNPLVFVQWSWALDSFPWFEQESTVLLEAWVESFSESENSLEQWIAFNKTLFTENSLNQLTDSSSESDENSLNEWTGFDENFFTENSLNQWTDSSPESDENSLNEWTGFDENFFTENSLNQWTDSSPESDENSLNEWTDLSLETPAMLLGWESHPHLLLTEVYAYGNDEWIEIYNNGDGDFQGKIFIYKNGSNYKNFTISLNQWTSIIIGDNMNMLHLDQLNYQSWASFNFVDTETLDLELRYDGTRLDSFFVSSNQIIINNVGTKYSRPSFEKIRSGNDYIITPTVVDRTKNTDWSILANPGVVFDFDFWEDPNPELGNLILTEVFFDDEDLENNRFEISNISAESFSGIVTLEGMGTDLFSFLLEIGANETKVFAQTGHRMFLNPPNIIEQEFEIDRNEGIRVILSYEDQQDILQVHPEWTQKLEGYGVSFEKVYFDQRRIPTDTKLDRRENVLSYYVANPGKYFSLTPEDAENLKDISLPINTTTPWDEEDIEDQVFCEDFWDKYTINISEVFLGNTIYPAFIELDFLDDFWDYEYLKLSGSFLKEPIIADWYESEEGWREKHTKLLIAQSDRRYEEWIDSQFDSNFSIKNQTGDLFLEWRDGQYRILLDIVDIPILSEGKSLYYGGKEYGCMRVFDEKADFSPGFDKKFLNFFQIDPEPRIEYIYVKPGGASCNCPTKADLCPGSVPVVVEEDDDEWESEEFDFRDEDDDPERWGEDPFAEPEPEYLVKILDIDYDPPGSDKDNETITLILLDGAESLDLTKLKLNFNNKNKKLKGVLEKGKELIIRGDFAFPNSTKDGSNIKVQLLLGDQVLDTYYYNPNQAKLDKEQEKEEQLPPSPGSVKVFSVLDGDTMRYRDEDGVLQSVRLLGIDAPESNTARYKKVECLGKETKEYLTKLIKNKYVQLVFDEQQQRDIYGRLLAYVYLDDLLVNEHLISEGYAKEYTYKIPHPQQTLFKQREQESRDKRKGIWSTQCLGENPELLDQPPLDYNQLIFKIKDIIYDPAGSDKDNEQIILRVFNAEADQKWINFGDYFGIYLTDGSGDLKNFEEPDFQLLEEGKFFSFHEFGNYPLDGDIVLQWDFKLPNSKPTCVSLMQKERILDVYCYDPAKKSENSLEGWTKNSLEQWTLPQIKITRLLPNPRGADSEKEQIWLLLSSYEENKLELDNQVSIKINGKTTKKLSGLLTLWEEQILQGTFSLPNSESCIQLYFGNHLLDTFCYPQPKEGVIFTRSAQLMEQIPTEELALIKQMKLKKVDKKVCLSYQNQYFNCLSTTMKLSEQDQEEQKLIRNSIRGVENMLRKNYAPLFYQTELKDYFSLVKEGMNAIKSGELLLNGRQRWSDIDSIFQGKYHQKNLELIHSEFQKILGKEFVEQYSLHYQDWLAKK